MDLVHKIFSSQVIFEMVHHPFFHVKRVLLYYKTPVCNQIKTFALYKFIMTFLHFLKISKKNRQIEKKKTGSKKIGVCDA